MMFYFSGRERKDMVIQGSVFSVLFSSMNGIGYLFTDEIGTKEMRKLCRKDNLNRKDAWD